ncbi:L-2-hydroxyglutarate oxidase [Actinomadura alba]|uniref:L-2-hydroxyglutarate oxidase n=1 Tax=Actinomadura alba TaxID=406431 RepID=A0ABR7M183_9ACTN|nr:L-2-hydroxyglutarate oxidase [Actinomadura alba]MBC6470885.1 L-2-hydroxyglutarate oxidase [Actinomadura alba]
MPGPRIAVIGGGIIGAAVTRQLLRERSDAEVTLLEKEDRLATHQTGRNSGVVHAGLYYTPGSLKARLCRQGVGLLRDFCSEHDLRYEECGKLLVARDPVERERLAGIAARAAANGVPGVRTVDAAQMRDIEPNVAGIAGLHSPSTAIVDFAAVTRRLADTARELGAAVRTGCAVTTLDDRASEVVVGGAGFADGYDLAIVCAGLHADRVARLAGDGDDPRIVPFRGEYYRLKPARRGLVRGLVYPVPDPRYPFLGVHITPRVDGEVLIGPNAVLALAREGYRRPDVRLADVRETFGWPGFRRFARRHWRTGAAEVAGSLSRRVFIARARRYVPELTVDDVLPGPSGVRAQALGADGALVDDFRITRNGRVVSVRNAPSPAATSALAIAEHIVRTALDRRS